MNNGFGWFFSVILLCMLWMVYEINQTNRENQKVVVNNPINKDDGRRYQEIEMEVTAYCPCKKCCGKFSDGKTSIGNDAYSRGVAVDPKVISYGTKIYIPDYGIAIADDCGSAIVGGKLDVRFKTHQEALEWGRRTCVVKVYSE